MSRKKVKGKSRVAQVLQVGRRGGYRWIDKLSAEDRDLALNVRSEVRSQGLPLLPIARNLITELNLEMNPQTISKWLREPD